MLLCPCHDMIFPIWLDHGGTQFKKVINVLHIQTEKNSTCLCEACFHCLAMIQQDT